jgi:competence ComEA-like helix-hairpin-helix protein
VKIWCVQLKTFGMIPLGAVAAVLLWVAATHAQIKLPDGPGKETVELVCTACHDLDTAIEIRHAKPEWRAIVQSMIDRGARATDDEVTTIVDYLGTQVGLVNVNKADAAEIEAVVAIPTAQAEAIVRYRTEKGDFKDLESLKNVPTVDGKVLEERKDRIVFQ